MIVKCIQTLNDITGKKVDSSERIHVGGTYRVLSMHLKELDRKFRAYIRIVEDIKIPPALHSIEQFDIVDPSLSPLWVVGLHGGTLNFSPIEWQRQGFWEDYFNDLDEAVGEFERLKLLISADEN
ncbi:hypothetical protein MF271_23270 (plasmid) [Deinococcus sp. KNUC1210]|uniref:hypothetical protein n=1 Tax=Deinococcus sp. KNUC1210 TaxID=2917691 RepID=UPI001EF0FAEB|nr:hypothetical protein [Deinococcus sp. KNUC1210]ULH17898.1 hypothetical protein MF271_23270 [Deinococcus sp. KNUC1210]